MQGFPLLTLLIFIPIIGMIVVLLLPKNSDNNIRYTTLGVTALQLVLSIVMMLNFDYSAGGIFEASSFQFIEKVRWIEIPNVAFLGTVKIDYFIGVDGLSAPLVLLSALIFFIATLSSWTIKKSPKGFFAMYLLLNSATMGVFLSLDFFLFFVFWEVMLLPMYFLIGIWGGPRKEYAAIKFFIYTMLGGIFMLITMLGLYFSATELLDNGTRAHTFNLLALMDQSNYLPNGILSISNPENWRLLAYIGLFAAFAVKIPMFPFHTWLPDAHVEAPTPISVVLAGVLLKLGTYGILRISFPIFPDITYELMWYIGLFGVINILYGAFAAMAQRDFKKLIAYSSISHMGYVLLGMASLSSTGLNGAIFQMFNHGTITAMLFLIVGIIYDRTHTRGLYDFGGLANQMPVYTGFVTVAFFAAIGLPGLSGWVSEALVFVGAFGVDSLRTMTMIAMLGILLGAGYMLWTLQRVYLGNLPDKWKNLKDLDRRELAMLIPLAIITVVLGIFPSIILDIMTTSVNTLVEFLQATLN